MRLETIPLVLGILMAIPGIALIADAFIPDGTFAAERRARPRPERNRYGEVALGVGLLLVAAALIGRDTWRYTTLAIILALVAFAAGLALNLKYVRGLMFGPVLGPTATRRSTDVAPSPETKEEEKIRIR
jgi:hypothetical protein